MDQIMACRLFAAKLLPESMPTQGRHFEDIFKFIFLYVIFLFWFKFYRNMLPAVRWSSICSDNGLASDKRQAIF